MNNLIEKAKAGDQNAIALLYSEHRPFVYNYILKRVQDRTEADDLTSKVFVRAIEKLHQYKEMDTGGFPNWLSRIAHNIIIDEWRKQKSIPMANVWERVHGLDDSAEDYAMLRINNAEFTKMIDFLTEAQQEVLILKYVYDLSNEQIAARVGTSIGAVKSIQHRAFDSLKESLKDENGSS